MRLMRLAPWLIAFEILRAGREHWSHLDPADRRMATDIMRRSKGDPRKLTPRDKKDLRDLSRRAELGKLLIALTSAAAVGRRKRRRG